MKVIKAVGEGPERRTYVEGGPECPNGIYLKHPDGTRSAFTSHINCPACHGTGLKAVEDWTDAEKAERLREIFEAVWIHYGSANEWSVAVLKEGAMNGETIRHSPDFSAALTAAVIAVAEEER